MLLLDGKTVRDKRAEELKAEIKALGFSPRLAIVQIGDSERSQAYIAQKVKFADKIGAKAEVFNFSETVSKDKVLEKIKELNADPNTYGIIVQLPLPENIGQDIIDAIDSNKDVDGLTPVNVKGLMRGDNNIFVPATARGVISLLDYYNIPIKFKKAVIVGRSLLVGKPIALSMLGLDATVTICHSQTENLPDITKQADILVVAVGKPKFIGAEYVREGQIVVDVGINVLAGEKLEEEIVGRKLVGDVDFEKVKDIVGAISPVPGGVGPMTVLSLFENLVVSAKVNH